MHIAIAEAKAQFAELIRRAEAGEEISLTRYGRPVARLTAVQSSGNRLIGCMEGMFTLPDDLSQSDKEVAELFHQSRIEPE